MSLPKHVKIVEVGPRDGLQAEKIILPVEIRIQFIDLLSGTGLQAIEVGSFVSPLWVPQLAESGAVYQGITKKENVDYSLLVPNQKGYEIALENNVKSIAVFTAASETFCHKNMNVSFEESIDRFRKFIPEAKAKGMRVRGYISCAISCPYEGPISPVAVHKVVSKLLILGCDEISLGDTTGSGTPHQVQDLLKDIPSPPEKLAVHFHDTYGQALANIYAALKKGISVIDCAVSGLGGCPYAPGTSGNVATEDVVFLLNGLEIKTKINCEKLLKAADFIDNHLNRQTSSKASRAMRTSHPLT